MREIRMSRNFLLLFVSLLLPIISSFSFWSRNRAFSSRNGFFQSRLSTKDDEGESPLIFEDPYVFLGRGSDAIVRPGVVLVPPVHEYSHFLMKSAIFVFAMGYDSEGTGLIRGVCLDNPTAFTMEEMSKLPGILGENILFRGGDVGNESVMMLHSCGSISDKENCSEQIGSSGIYEGGIQAALSVAADGEADPEWFKFFFNYVEFTDVELNKILAEVDTEGDAWMSLEVPSSFVLADHDKNEAWSALRNKVRQMNW